MRSIHPPLSVVVPSHNTRNLTGEAIESVFAQAPPNTEVIVVDDGSSDGTSDWLAQRWPTVTVLRTEQSTGFSASANRGLNHAEGEILLLLNSDAALAANALQPMIEAFETQSDLGIIGAVLQYPDGRPQWSGGRFPNLSWLFALTSGVAVLARNLPLYRRFKKPGTQPIGPVQWVTGAAMAVRRSLWDDLGPLDEAYNFYGQDLDLCRRASESDWKIDLIPGFVATHHHGATISEHDDSTASAHPEFLWTDLLRFVRKNYGRGAGRRARWVMVAGANLRLAAMTLALPLSSSSSRKARKTNRDLYRKAAEALRTTAL